MSIKYYLKDIFTKSIKKSFNDIPSSLQKSLIYICTHNNLGDYQCNNAMPIHHYYLKKTTYRTKGYTSLDIGQKIINNINLDNTYIQELNIKQPGFINIKIKISYLNDLLLSIIYKKAKCADIIRSLDNQSKNTLLHHKNRNIIIDYSSPNIAKEMHVGHLRSTILGDAIANILEYIGHNVTRINHIGDWGTPFGMIIHYIKKNNLNYLKLDLKDLHQIYQKSQLLYKTNEKFYKQTQYELYQLQFNQSEENIKIWNYICNISRQNFNKIYKYLNISKNLIEQGESTYYKSIPNIIKKLQKYTTKKDNEPLYIFQQDKGYKFPLILQKSNGCYTYDTTDLAAIYQRLKVKKYDDLYYIVDKGQRLHFEMIFDLAKEAHWVDEQQKTLNYISFGLILGKDHKKLKTRCGKSIKLLKLLKDGYNYIQNNNPTMSKKDILILNRASIKYADLSQHRNSDYLFSYEKMLNLKDNTAIYLLYTYARINSIINNQTSYKSEINFIEQEEQLKLDLLKLNNDEKKLILTITQFNDTLIYVIKSWEINVLCEYLYSLCSEFSTFYSKYHILNDKNRLIISYSILMILKQGLELLGIETVEKI